MSTTETVSIIIPTGDRLEALTRTLESIEKYAPGNEVIVIGNRNDKRTAESLQKSFREVKYLSCDEPSAVVKRNIGIAHSTKRILVFVDDDVVVEGTWLPSLLQHYENTSIGGVGGRVKVPGQPSGSSKFKTGVIRDGFVIGNWDPPGTQIVEVEHLIGCNMSLRKDPVVKLGGFDNFFRSCNFREETDLCLSTRRLGYRILFDPKASLFHLALGGKKQGSRWTFYYVRNTFYLYLKYQQRRAPTLPKFLRNLLFPPREYMAAASVTVRLSPITPLVAISGLLAGLLGYLGHR